jgi:hypothetical protein
LKEVGWGGNSFRSSPQQGFGRVMGDQAPSSDDDGGQLAFLYKFVGGGPANSVPITEVIDVISALGSAIGFLFAHAVTSG